MSQLWNFPLFVKAFVLALIISGFFVERAAGQAAAYERIFVSDTYKLVLGFDLRDSSAPASAIVANNQLDTSPQRIDIAIPFVARNVVPNEDLLLRTGVFHTWTLFTYNEPRQLRWPQFILFTPVFDTISDQLGTNLPGSLYFSFTSDGQLVRFLYRYPRENQFPLDTKSFDAIAVAIPRNATPVGVRGGRTEVPSRQGENEFAQFYPPRPASQTEPFLEIRYLVPATDFRKIVVEYGTKLMRPPLARQTVVARIAKVRFFWMIAA
jgi:hypothetical protein